MSALNIEVISRKRIKPSHPTPKHLQTFKLSLWDKEFAPTYGTVIFFYQSNAIQNDHDEIRSMFFKKSYSLQESLSETLVHYYPLAGELKDDLSTIDCNDEGAHFVEARIDCQLSTFLAKPEAQLWKNFTPVFDPSNIPSGCMLVIQLTLFSCGGIAISVNISHKLADGSSLCTFVQSWVSMTTQESGKLVSPNPIFVESTFSPTPDMLSMPRPFLTVGGSLVTKRFVFPSSKIAKLKESITSAQQNLSDVDLVLSVIMRCAISASRSSTKSSGPYVLFQSVNMRKRLRPPLPENTIGNILWCTTLEIEEDQLEIKELAGKIRENLTKLYSTGTGSNNTVKENNKEPPLMNIKGHPYGCTSLCRFPIYEMDFGWGKPSWTAIPFLVCRNLIVLQKTKDGNGIEAWICLDEKEMAQFENDGELLSFACTELAVLANHSRM